MADKWEEQLKQFWTRAGEDIRRAGEELREEAQRLVASVKDPEKQQAVMRGMREFTQTAKKAVEDAAVMFEQALDKAGGKVQGAWSSAANRNTHQSDAPTPTHNKAKKPAGKKAPAKKAAAKKPAAKKGKK